jgi:flavin-dependent dehydrogenase
MFWNLFHWHWIQRRLYKFVTAADGKHYEITMRVGAWARSWNKDEVHDALVAEVVKLKKEQGWKDDDCYKF